MAARSTGAAGPMSMTARSSREVVGDNFNRGNPIQQQEGPQLPPQQEGPQLPPQFQQQLQQQQAQRNNEPVEGLAGLKYCGAGGSFLFSRENNINVNNAINNANNANNANNSNNSPDAILVLLTLQKRGRRPDRAVPGRVVENWEGAKGRIERGDSARGTAWKETREETGYHPPAEETFVHVKNVFPRGRSLEEKRGCAW
jgi:hypothetical protein